MNVFISHSHRDKEVVHRIADDLKRHGIVVWLDEDLVTPGEPWAEKLSQAVEQSDAVVVVISRNTGTAQWQTSEIAFAIAAQKRNPSKRVIPVLVDKGADVPFFLKTLLYCDLSDDNAYQHNFPQLVQALERPQSVSFSDEDVDRLRIESLKVERALLAGEKEALQRKRIMWMTSVLGALASVFAATLTMFAGLLVPGRIDWGHGTVHFVIGAAVGVSASIIAFAATRALHARSNRREGSHANQ